MEIISPDVNEKPKMFLGFIKVDDVTTTEWPPWEAQITTPEDVALLQQDLNSLQDREKTWMMEFHPDICQLLRVTNKRKIIQAEYTIHNQKLTQADQAKYLGVKR